MSTIPKRSGPSSTELSGSVDEKRVSRSQTRRAPLFCSRPGLVTSQHGRLIAHFTSGFSGTRMRIEPLEPTHPLKAPFSFQPIQHLTLRLIMYADVKRSRRDHLIISLQPALSPGRDKHHLLMKIQLFSTHLDGLPLWHLVMADNYVQAVQMSLTWRHTECMAMNF